MTFEPHVEKLQGFLADNHLGHVAEVFKTYAFNWETYVIALAPALLVERIFPLERRKVLSPNLAFDALMPIFDGVAFGGVVNGLGMVSVKLFYESHPPFWDLRLLDSSPVWVQAIGAYLTATLMAYIAHRLLHKIPWLWHFHSVHHSQRRLNPFTTKRAHFVEDLFTIALAAIPIGLIGGSYPTWFWIPVLNGYYSYFIHANAKLHFGPLRWLLVSPQMHRIHHSTDPKHHDTNYCTEIAIWDYLFGTAYPHYRELPAETGILDYPVPEETSRKPHALFMTWLRLNVHPFRQIGRSLRKLLFERG